MWANQCERLDDVQMKRALNVALKAGGAHPPTLPEFLRWARGQVVTNTAEPLPECTPAELAVNRWFLHRAVRQRFAGVSDDKLMAIRLAAVAAAAEVLPHLLAGDPDITQADLIKTLDEIVVRIVNTVGDAA